MPGIGYLVDRREQEVNQRTVKHPGDLQGQKMLPVRGDSDRSKRQCCRGPGIQVLGSLSARWNHGALVWPVLKWERGHSNCQRRL